MRKLDHTLIDFDQEFIGVTITMPTEGGSENILVYTLKGKPASLSKEKMTIGKTDFLYREVCEKYEDVDRVVEILKKDYFAELPF
jgi:hypothetical protein